MAEETESDHAKEGDNFLNQITEPPNEFRDGFENLTNTSGQHIKRASNLSLVSEPEEPATVVVCEAIVEHIPTSSRRGAIAVPSLQVDAGGKSPRRAVTFSSDVPDADEIKPMPYSPPHRLPPPMKLHEEHLANWHNDARHRAYYYNEPWCKPPKPKRAFPRRTSSIATLNHRSLCPCMSANPRFAALLVHRESGFKSNDWDYIMSAPGLPTIEEEAYEIPRQIQPPMKPLRAIGQYDFVMPAEWIDSRDKFKAKTCLEVTGYPNTNQRLNMKWLIQKFSCYPGYRGYMMNWAETKAHVYFNRHEQVLWARRNLQGTLLSDSQCLCITIIEVMDPVEETSKWWGIT